RHSRRLPWQQRTQRRAPPDDWKTGSWRAYPSAWPVRAPTLAGPSWKNLGAVLDRLRRRDVSARQKPPQVRAVPALVQRLGVCGELVVGDPPVAPGDLLGTGDLQPLAFLHHAHELRGLHHRRERP